MGLKITGRRQFCRVETQLQRHWLLLLAGSFVTQPHKASACTYTIILFFNYFLKLFPHDLNPLVLVKPLLLQLQLRIANANPNLLPSSYFPLGIQKKGSF